MVSIAFSLSDLPSNENQLQTLLLFFLFWDVGLFSCLKGGFGAFSLCLFLKDRKYHFCESVCCRSDLFCILRCCFFWSRFWLICFLMAFELCVLGGLW